MRWHVGYLAGGLLCSVVLATGDDLGVACTCFVVSKVALPLGGEALEGGDGRCPAGARLGPPAVEADTAIGSGRALVGTAGLALGDTTLPLLEVGFLAKVLTAVAGSTSVERCEDDARAAARCLSAQSKI